MQTFWQDLRYGARMLLKKPGFTAVAIIAIALGIGANTAIFSVVNGVLLHSLPYSHAERIIRISVSNPPRGITDSSFSYPRFQHMEQQTQSVESIAAFCGESYTLTGNDEPEQISGARVSPSIFQVLGVNPVLGRAFRPEEGERGGNNVVILGQRFFQQHFGGDLNLIGQPLTLNGASYTVIGVMPADFNFPFEQTDMWTPQVFENSRIDANGVRLGAGYLAAVARLREGVSVQQARAELDTISHAYQQQSPTLIDADPNATMNVARLQDYVVQDIRTALLMLFAAVGFVLLIACANVANLLLVRAAARYKEIAIRAAMGASRLRIARQLLTESLLLSLIGGTLGLMLAAWGVDLLMAASDSIIPRTKEVHMDGRVLAFSFVISIMTGIIFGLAPTLKASTPDLHEALKEGNRGSTEGRHRNRLRSLLVVSEVALSLVLLIGAGLLIQSFIRLQHVHLGFNPQNVLTFRVQLSPARYAENHQRTEFFNQAIQRIGEVPGVESVGATLGLPPDGYAMAPFQVEGSAPVPNGERPLASWDVTSEGFFPTMQIKLLSGRFFNDHDTADRQAVTIINEAMAHRYFPDVDPIGKHMNIGRYTTPFEIVGVVADVQSAGISTTPGPHIYVTYRQTPWSAMSIVVRTTSDPLMLTDAVRGQVLTVDKNQPITSVQSMEQVLSSSVSQPRLVTLLLGIFAAVAVALAAVGIYGVMSYSIAQRTHEIGIRLALGAERKDVLRLVVGQGLRLALTGVGVGLVAAFACMRMLSSLLFGTSATDPLTYAAVTVILLNVALLACFVPARRATKVDPMIALRSE